MRSVRAVMAPRGERMSWRSTESSSSLRRFSSCSMFAGATLNVGGLDCISFSCMLVSIVILACVL